MVGDVQVVDLDALEPSQWRRWLTLLEREIRGAERVMGGDGKIRWVGKDSPMLGKGRRLTFEEWGRIKHLIREHNLICIPRNACMGFGCAITIYEESEPICVGVPPMPRRLIDITRSHVPSVVDYPGPTFDEAWAEFSPFTHTDENKRRAKWERLPRIREKTHYEY